MPITGMGWPEPGIFLVIILGNRDRPAVKVLKGIPAGARADSKMQKLRRLN